MSRIGTAAFILILGLVTFTFQSLRARPAALHAKNTPPIIFVEAPEVVAGALTGRFPRGSRIVRLAPGDTAGSVANLTPDFFAAADPRVSFDASRVLFSGRKTRRAHWQIWEMKTDGSGLRQITRGAADCLRPAYLPRREIVYTAVEGKTSSALYVCKRDGSGAHAITFGPGGFQVETVLQSGRLLVSADRVLAPGARPRDSRTLYTLRPDGTGLAPFRQDARPNLIRTEAEELEDGTVLFVERRDPEGRASGGELAWIRPGALHNSVLTSPRSVYWSAHVLDGNRWVVAKQPSAAAGKYGLYIFNSATRTVGKAIYQNPRFSSVQAVPVEPRSVPREYWSILHPQRDYGRVVCLDSYLSADAPHGRLAAHIARVRVIALQPDHRRERTLGEAPVESDGSFYIKVPANRPIRFELIGPQGSVVRAQRSWVWARNGEDVACLGCHEDKAIVPTDRFPLALKSFQTPTPVGVPSHSHPQRH